MPNDNKDSKEFPDVGHKLSAPKKLSAYEKERQHAEAKRIRDEAETAAALREFQEDFGDDPPDSFEQSGSYHGDSGRGFGDHGPVRRGPAGLRSGPGSLGPMPGAPPSMKKRRALDQLRDQQQPFPHDSHRSFGHMSTHRSKSGSSYDNDEEVEDAVPKPTVLLSSLPPVMSSRKIFDLLKEHIDVVDVELLPPQEPNSGSISAIATLAAGTPPNKIDIVVSALRDKYIGFGHFLSISRHLSSQSISAVQATTSTANRSAYPYGATKRTEAGSSLRKAPPPRDYSAFAPPDQFDSMVRDQPQAEAVVHVCPPLDLSSIRTIHTIADTLLSEPDPHRAMEMEALLMSKEKVQQDERFAFLFDSTSPAGIYYRYLLWGPDHLDTKAARAPQRIDDSYDIEWTSPHGYLPFPDLTDLAEAVDHVDYDSSDEESNDDDSDQGPSEVLQNPDGSSTKPKHGALLSPLHVARLTSMLAELPTSRARLRNSDVSGITYFAIKHAGRGADEIVDYLLLNITQPFSGTSAAKYMLSDSDHDDPLDAQDGHTPFAGQETREPKREDDPSDARLIGLYIIADVLSAASVAGVKNAWKYRQLIEAGLIGHRTFEQLGRIDKDLKMGRMKAEQWKKRVEHVLSLWRGNNTFSVEGQEAMEQAFAQPPLTEDELQEKEWVERRKRAVGSESAKGSLNARPMTTQRRDEETDSVRMDEDEDVDGEPMSDEDVDGVPMTEEDLDALVFESIRTTATDDPMDMTDDISGKDSGKTDAGRALTSGGDTTKEPNLSVSMSLASKASENASTNAQTTKRRMRAEDMFADSDED